MPIKSFASRYNYKRRNMMRKPRPSRLRTVQKMTGIKRRYARTRLEARINNLESRLASEVRYYDSNVAPTAIDNTGTFNALLNSVSQGDGETNRQGEHVKSKNLIINYTAKINASATNTTMSMAIILDKKPEVGSAPWTTVYASAVPQSLFNKDNGDRFVVLKHVQIGLNNAGRNAINGQLYIPLTNIPVEWNSATGTDFSTNRLAMIAISDEATNTPTLSVYSRYNFYDN